MNIDEYINVYYLHVPRILALINNFLKEDYLNSTRRTIDVYTHNDKYSFTKNRELLRDMLPNLSKSKEDERLLCDPLSFLVDYTSYVNESEAWLFHSVIMIETLCTTLKYILNTNECCLSYNFIKILNDACDACIEYYKNYYDLLGSKFITLPPCNLILYGDNTDPPRKRELQWFMKNGYKEFLKDKIIIFKSKQYKIKRYNGNKVVLYSVGSGSSSTTATTTTTTTTTIKSKEEVEWQDAY